ncbi:MAG: hypothetical protein WCX65_06670 [bacterium]
MDGLDFAVFFFIAVAAFLFAIAISVGLTRWIFRINDIVDLLKGIHNILVDDNEISKSALSRLQRIDYFAEHILKQRQ